GRLVAINAVDPTKSTKLTPVGSIPDGFVGYSSDQSGLFYSINTAADPDQLLVSRGVVPTLGEIDLDAGTFTNIASLFNLIAQIGQVKAMAFAPGEGSIPGQQGLYIIDGNNKFYEVNPLTGTLLTNGDELVDAMGNEVAIASMAFDRNGRLFGVD